MAVAANTYGTNVKVEARIGDIVNARNFSESTIPTRGEVELLLDDVASVMNAQLSAKGFTVKVSSSDVHAFNSLVTANVAEASAQILAAHFPGEAFDPDNPARFIGRAANFHAIYRDVMDMVEDGTLPATRSVSGEIPKAVNTGRLNSQGNVKKPLFTRTLHEYPSVRSTTEE